MENFNHRERRKIDTTMHPAIERFDVAMSNPPYQDARNSAIFHIFQHVADSIAHHTTLIYPADKWMMKSGKGEGLDAFAAAQLNSPNITSLFVYEDTDDIFGGIELHGGISIITKDFHYDNHGIIPVTTVDFAGEVDTQHLRAPGEKTISTSNGMNAIVQKVHQHHDSTTKFLDSCILPTSLYGISSNFIEQHRDVAIPDHEYQPRDGYVRVLTNAQTGTQGRVAWFWVPLDTIPKLPAYHTKYVVAISTRHAAGYGGRSQQAYIFKPYEFFGDSRYGVAAFDTLEEAENFFTWLGSNVVRVLILSSSRRIKNFGINVPLLSSYRTKEAEIDFSQSVDEQLIAKYGLTEDEVAFINARIATLGAFAMPTPHQIA